MTPAGGFSATAAPLRVAVSGITVECASSTLSGSIAASGTGSVTGWSFVRCIHRSLGAVTVTPALPSSLTLTLSTAVDASVTSVSLGVRTAIGCAFTAVGSASDTYSGTLPLSLPALTFSRSALVASGVSNCLGLISNGNAVTLDGTFALASGWTIS